VDDRDLEKKEGNEMEMIGKKEIGYERIEEDGLDWE
jgi:hypothetical protein